MTNLNEDPRRITAEIDAVKALLDAELYAEDPTHPDHIPMPSDSDIESLAMQAFERARDILKGEEVTVDELNDPIDDYTLAAVLATWTAELELVSSTSRAATPGNGRLWKVRVNDPEVIAAVLGVNDGDPLWLTVYDVATEKGMAVTVTLTLASEVAPRIALSAVVDYGNGVVARIPLSDDEASEQDVDTMSGSATVPTDSSEPESPILTLDVQARPA